MALILETDGKKNKEHWRHNFEEVDQRLNDNTLSLAAKVNGDEKDAANGIATLNPEKKLVQTALNSDKLGGKTVEEITASSGKYNSFIIDGFFDGTQATDENSLPIDLGPKDSILVVFSIYETLPEAGHIIRFADNTAEWDGVSALPVPALVTLKKSGAQYLFTAEHDMIQLGSTQLLQDRFDEKADAINRTADINNADPLSYPNTPAVKAVLDTKQDLTEKGQPNGYPSLNSNAQVPVEQLPDAILGATKFKGFWDAASNVIQSEDGLMNDQPMPEASAELNMGWYFIVTNAGNTDINGINEWGLGDWIISIGSEWGKVKNTDAVISVAGKIGNVVLTGGDIAQDATHRFTSDAEKATWNAKLGVADVIDSLNATATNKPLSAKQGKQLKDNADALAGSLAAKLDAAAFSAITASWQKAKLSEENGSAITLSDDLDQYFLTGIYSSPSVGLPNEPDDMEAPYMLFVVRDDDSSYSFQTLINTSLNMYIRYSDGGSWSPWVMMANRTYVDSQLSHKLNTNGTAANSNQLGGKTLATVESERDTAIINAINNIVAGAPAAYDTLIEIANYITTDAGIVAALQAAMNARVQYSDIVDNLTTQVNNKPLSANQGYVLKQAVDAKVAVADIIDAINTTITNKPLSARQGKVLGDAINTVTGMLGGKVDNFTANNWQKTKITDDNGRDKFIGAMDFDYYWQNGVGTGIFMLGEPMNAPPDINNTEWRLWNMMDNSGNTTQLAFNKVTGNVFTRTVWDSSPTPWTAISGTSNVAADGSAYTDYKTIPSGVWFIPDTAILFPSFFAPGTPAIAEVIYASAGGYRKIDLTPFNAGSVTFYITVCIGGTWTELTMMNAIAP